MESNVFGIPAIESELTRTINTGPLYVTIGPFRTRTRSQNGGTLLRGIPIFSYIRGPILMMVGGSSHDRLRT